MRMLSLTLVIISAFLLGLSTNALALVGLDDYTVLLLHCDGTDGSTSFVDDSFQNHPVTVYGDAQIDTAQQKFGTASALFDGDGDYLSIPDSDDWYFGTGDFTIDMWVRFRDFHPAYSAIYSQYTDAQFWNAVVWMKGANAWRFAARIDGLGNAVITASDSIFLNTWYHVAVVRDGDIFKIYRDGILKGSVTASDYLPDLPADLWMGRYADWGRYFEGWLDEIRVSKGIARWTANFTPPTEEYGIPEPEPEPYVIPEPTSLLLLGFSLLTTRLFKKRDGSA